MTSDLLSRLERADAGSRELDALVAEALGWNKDDAGEWHAVGIFFDDGVKRRTAYAVELPPWTTNVDAALTLVPAGWWLTIKMFGKYFHIEGLFDADTADRDLAEDEEIFDGELVRNAPTLPLAIIRASFAALRAREPRHG